MKIDKLLFETEIFFDDLYLTESIIRSIHTISSPARMGNINNNYNLSNGVPESELHGIASAYAGVGILATVGIGGIYALLKYLDSVNRLKRLINKLEIRYKNISDPEKKNEIDLKIRDLRKRLNIRQKELRVKYDNYIKTTQKLKLQVQKLEQDGKTEEASKLKDKLNKRMKFIEKIGAKI